MIKLFNLSENKFLRNLFQIDLRNEPAYGEDKLYVTFKTISTGEYIIGFTIARIHRLCPKQTSRCPA